MVMASATTNGAAAAADEHEEVPLFHPSPCAQHYYVQSPSAASDSMALILSPFPNLHNDHEEASRLTLSRYSSSRGSNTSFPAAAGYDNNDVTKKPSRRRQTLTVLSNPSGGDDADDDAVQGHQRSGAWRYVKLDPDAPCCCIAFQVAWRVLASAAFALLLFVLATRPRHPGVSFRVGRVERFSLGEGVDGSGVETSFLDCNCSVDMVVENHSKVFGLHVRPPPLLQLSFGRFVFASSRGWDVSSAAHEVAPRAASTLRMFVAVKEKPMYAAGRGMQDMLESSSRGLPLTVTVRARSRYRVVGSLVRLTYRHDSECVVHLRRSPRRNNDVAAAGRGTCSALS
ncbi:hypothetical protein PR202_ga26584 [Eleusine coracana subsp. coracana]|uniref:Late embryogenesis abundant protein LEA-2 subgroup domain-containing protein n=1 Tax=Eleusine coracana subsp. coracana TaxID=191504 RepID=A0AAV5DDP9_ELECO|nr:hypothetical protein QOZ80_3AG0238930 [Eleusine coracana subsp. coracana]GJN08642.1 hypothetical protein PR202_ga26584 [Eleusine coracana subsp. coracana]